MHPGCCRCCVKHQVCALATYTERDCGMLCCILQDLSPKYASALLGITNTAGAIPGVLGVTSAGYLLDVTGSWQWALFFPTAAFQLLGAVFYSIFASSERQHWS